MYIQSKENGYRISIPGSTLCLGCEESSRQCIEAWHSFEKACEVFFDPFVLIEDASPSDEERQAAIGLAEDWDLLFVVHLIREKDAIRIVSARRATAQERNRYEND